LKFALGLLQSQTGAVPEALIFRQAVEQVQLAEALGFHSAWFTEQHFNDFGVCPDPLLLIAHLAAKTQEIRLGTSVVVLSLHNPMVLAERAAFADQLSGGRLDLGIGKGHPRQNYTAFGMDPSESEARFYEAHDFIMKAWSGEEFSFEGAFFRAEKIRLVPRPVQAPHPPIWVASFGNPAMLRFAARNGYPLLHTFTGDSLRQNLQLYRSEYRGSGGQGSILTRMVYLEEDGDRAREEMRLPARWYIDNNPGRPAAIASYELAVSEFIHKLGIIGSPEECIEQIHSLHSEHQIDHLACIFGPGGVPHEKIMASMRLFAEKVIPEFADVSSPETRGRW
jgi:alkanesulfonate monooxygenase SsuD/methylene tetrahydromethanopterin reductase-like flavin-dependent oxidoreductase (luciferase family)